MTFIKIVLFAALAAGFVKWAWPTILPGARGLSFKFGRMITAALALAGVLVLFSGVGYVGAGTRGVVLRFGAVTGRVLQEGIYFITPVAETIAMMSVQTEAYEAEAEAASRDLQDVHTKVTLNYSLDPAQVGEVYRTLRYQYQERIIKPAVQESVKAATALFKAEELITQRPVVKEKIESLLRVRLAAHGIRVDTISITNFNFSEAFNSAIEAKVTAQQLALKAQRDLERIKTEAEQKVAQARAEAESLRLQKQNVTPQLLELRRIEATIKWIEKWKGDMPQVVTPGMVPFFSFQPGQPEPNGGR